MSGLLSAMTGKCPACGKGALYRPGTLLTLHELCPACHVRYERWSGSWTIPTVMGYGSAALFATALGFYHLKTGQLEGSEARIVGATVVFTLFFYPLCKNLSVFMLWNNGFIFVDPPSLVKGDEAPGAADAPAAAAPPVVPPPVVPPAGPSAA